MSDYREGETGTLRVLFCFGVSQSFFDEIPARVPELIDAVRAAFDDRKGRFGISVLGTMDDDELMVGPSLNFPWTAYILADAPDLRAVTAVCNVLRETEFGEAHLGHVPGSSCSTSGCIGQV